MKPTREVPLSKGYVAIVDADDYEAVMAAGKWSALENNGLVYAVRNFPDRDGRRVLKRLHAFLTGWPLTDHINGDGLDNRRANLRPATKEQNGRNAALSRRNTSGFKGVTRSGTKGRWVALIGTGQGRQARLGTFDSAEEAARAYDAAALALWGEYARPNFPVPSTARRM